MTFRIILLYILISGIFGACKEQQDSDIDRNQDVKTAAKMSAPKSPAVAAKASPSDKDEKKKSVANKAAPLTKQELLGRRMFITCSACHSLKEGEAHKVGPNLYGFLGSAAAGKEGYTYSEALISANIVWNENTLKEWLGNPAGYVPGTKMAFIGIEEEEKQDALIAYLKRETKKNEKK